MATAASARWPQALLALVVEALAEKRLTDERAPVDGGYIGIVLAEAWITVPRRR
ncbi:hypothetical protein [Streptomyces sp. NPDC057557]|uniref:hypothetical protein n=1 Tax=Streptomyces sp. NPDC057557 TaxID=3346167 RepID=UPI0036A58928